MIKAGIIGGGGYAAGELIRLLLAHPYVQISFVYSKSQSGKYLHEVHTDLLGDTDLQFSGSIDKEADVLFLCSGHGKSREFLKENPVSGEVKIIDLSHDHRLDPEFTYGLPEINKYRYHHRIANPGCFATAIQLALLPLAGEKQLNTEVHAQAITGSTGAGQGLTPTGHFSWRENNVSVYKPFTHQHLPEIKATLEPLQGEEVKISFVPLRGPFTRGIFASIYLDTEEKEITLRNMYNDYYHDEMFVVVSRENIDLKQVINTNKCLIYIQKTEGKLLICSAIDNLLKGASGQAVQNMNILFGLSEDTGLKLKASSF